MFAHSVPRKVAHLLVLALVCGLLAVASTAAPPTVEEALEAFSDLPFDGFVEESYRQIMLRDPDTIWSEGLQTYYGVDSFSEWTDHSSEAFAETCRLDHAVLAALRSYDRSSLGAEEKLTYDTYMWLLEDRIRQQAYPRWDYVIGPSSYGVHNLALELLGHLPIDSVDTAEDYIARLRGTSVWMDQLLDVYRAREPHGVIPTELAIDMTLDELDDSFPQIPDTKLARILDAYTTFVERLNDLDDLDSETRSSLLAGAQDAIITSLIPAYRAFRDYVASLKGKGGTIGVSGYEGADTYYAVQLEHHVTKSISPEEVHEIGKREVTRLQTQMRTYASEHFGWPTDLSMKELSDRLDARNVPILQGNALLEEYQRLVDAAKASLGTVFDVFPESDLVITVERYGPPCYNRPPPIDRSGPGEIVTSLMNPLSFTAYDEPVLMHHEGVPGHHFQMGLQRDIDLPGFRRDCLPNVYTRHPMFQAFIEGWALYSEPLAHEMGLYDDDPIGGLCQMRLELIRLARLVTDTGLNALGWSWNQTADYLREATGQTVRSTESLRYAAYPAQQAGCGMGYVTFVELRRRAEEELGDAFDLKEFHRVILGNGAIPMEVLECVVEEWLAEKAASI